MIFREMPPIWDPGFRPGFYARWGYENAVISAKTRRAEYPEYHQLLSVKMIHNGSEDYFIDGRRVAVDDDTFLILNAGRRYASRIDGLKPAHSFSIFFRPGLAEEVLDSMLRPSEALLSNPESSSLPRVEFDEQLREHDGSVTPVLRFIQGVVDSGTADPLWLEEQLRFLMARMLAQEQQRARVQERVPSAKATTRHELHRRLRRGVTYIHTHYREAIALRQMAAAAHMSPFHFLRTFRAVYGITPSVYLNRKRTEAAVRLIRESGWPLTEVAEHVGFGSRTTLYRQLRAHGGGRQGPELIQQ